MIYDYYPGCTLKNQASALEKSALTAAEALGVGLRELPEWQCCGGVYPMASNENAHKLPSVRALQSAKENGRDLLTVCSACYHVLKSVNYDMKNSDTVRNKVHSYAEIDYGGETRVLHFLEMLRDDIGFETLRQKVTKPLTGQRIAPYYGCLILRPSAIIGFDDAENPRIMEDYIASLGGEAVVYPFRNECCGGYMAAENRTLTEKKCRDIIGSAKAHGADCIITACPLCYYNLKKYSDIPVRYFTQILCEALGIGEDEA